MNLKKCKLTQQGLMCDTVKGFLKVKESTTHISTASRCWCQTQVDATSAFPVPRPGLKPY